MNKTNTCQARICKFVAQSALLVWIGWLGMTTAGCVPPVARDRWRRAVVPDARQDRHRGRCAARPGAGGFACDFNRRSQGDDDGDDNEPCTAAGGNDRYAGADRHVHTRPRRHGNGHGCHAGNRGRRIADRTADADAHADDNALSHTDAGRHCHCPRPCHHHCRAGGSGAGRQTDGDYAAHRNASTDPATANPAAANPAAADPATTDPAAARDLHDWRGR